MKVYVLDICGYDARGGSAQVFATLEGAKTSVPHVRWIREPGESPCWAEDVAKGSLADMWVINEVEVGP